MEDEYRAGSKADFDRLYEAAYPRLFATLVAVLRSRADAEDCVQEAFVRAFQAWPRWQADAPAEAWLHRIALNVAISHRRKERLRQVGEVVRRLGVPTDPDPIDAAADPLLLTALRELPPKQAAALVLRHVHGYSNREIAQAVGVPERTIASRLAAARERVQARLGGAAGTETGTSPAPGVSPVR